MGQQKAGARRCRQVPLLRASLGWALRPAHRLLLRALGRVRQGGWRLKCTRKAPCTQAALTESRGLRWRWLGAPGGVYELREFDRRHRRMQGTKREGYTSLPTRRHLVTRLAANAAPKLSGYWAPMSFISSRTYKLSGFPHGNAHAHSTHHCPTIAHAHGRLGCCGGSRRAGMGWAADNPCPAAAHAHAWCC